MYAHQEYIQKVIEHLKKGGKIIFKSRCDGRPYKDRYDQTQIHSSSENDGTTSKNPLEQFIS